MNRRSFLKAAGSAALLPMLPHRLWAGTNFRRRRPSDAAWPSQAAWKRLNDAVGGNLKPVNFPLSVLKTDPSGDAARALWRTFEIRTISVTSPASPRLWDGSRHGRASQASMPSRREMPTTLPRR